MKSLAASTSILPSVVGVQAILTPFLCQLDLRLCTTYLSLPEPDRSKVYPLRGKFSLNMCKSSIKPCCKVYFKHGAGWRKNWELASRRRRVGSQSESNRKLMSFSRAFRLYSEADREKQVGSKCRLTWKSKQESGTLKG